jgi:PII-like signaling protein
MKTQIKTHLSGKLRIYLKTGENIKSKTLLRKLFPTRVYSNLIKMAKEDGIINASVFTTHMSFSNNNNEKITQYSFESENSGLTVCVELIDTKEKLQEFFIKHKDSLKDKVVIYKEVEFWDVE